MNWRVDPPSLWQGASAWQIRDARAEDRSHIQRLVDSARWRHQHLDWSDALSLIDSEPFLLAFERGRPIGCLACPPERPDLTWLRLFALAGGRDLTTAWSRLWAECRRSLERMKVGQVWALATYAWLLPRLDEAGFRAADGVVFLEYDGRPAAAARPSLGQLRAMTPQDWPAVLALDGRAFEPAWALSQASLRAAASQAAIASVIEADGRLLGYQISTSSVYGVHLARLAVEPDMQARGLGAALIADVLAQAERLGMPRISVNTQSDNRVSRRLYVRMGFRETGQEFPVYRLDLGGPGKEAGHGG